MNIFLISQSIYKSGQENEREREREREKKGVLHIILKIVQ
jgi:hypothetical protein